MPYIGRPCSVRLCLRRWLLLSCCPIVAPLTSRICCFIHRRKEGRACMHMRDPLVGRRHHAWTHRFCETGSAAAAAPRLDQDTAPQIWRCACHLATGMVACDSCRTFFSCLLSNSSLLWLHWTVAQWPGRSALEARGNQASRSSRWRILVSDTLAR